MGCNLGQCCMAGQVEAFLDTLKWDKNGLQKHLALIVNNVSLNVQFCSVAQSLRKYFVLNLWLSIGSLQ
jgi:hypothetical protein